MPVHAMEHRRPIYLLANSLPPMPTLIPGPTPRPAAKVQSGASPRQWHDGVSAYQASGGMSETRSHTWSANQCRHCTTKPRTGSEKDPYACWMLCTSAGELGTGWAPSFAALVFWRAVTGVGSSAQYAGRELFLSDISSVGNRGRTLGAVTVRTPVPDGGLFGLQCQAKTSTQNLGVYIVEPA